MRAIQPGIIADLLPTQMTVGLREVGLKRKRLREKMAEKDGQSLGARMVPVVLGPEHRRYMIDRHHFTSALHAEGVREVPVVVIADLSALEQHAFWAALDDRRWTHPFDANGRRHDYDAIPKSVGDLIDDPFRSLAGELKRAGGYAKVTTPFSEFRWANFLRHRIECVIVEREFDRAVELAMKLAAGSEAMDLPGWRGPRPVH